MNSSRLMNMHHLVDLYRFKLNLPHAIFTCIDHEDTIVATVFKIYSLGKPDLILKICDRKEDVSRESYFFNRFKRKIPFAMEKFKGLSIGPLVEGDFLKLIFVFWN